MIFRRILPGSQDRSIRDLYGVIVAQARREAFYARYGVPDTLEGRFDLIVLHLVLVIERLTRTSAAQDAGQRLFDAFCVDLDGNLREMGVGDLAVPKRMRAFGEAFYGRQAAYLAAFAAADRRELEKALCRNIFLDEDKASGAERLARYARQARRAFEDQEDGALLRGKAIFPDPDSIAETALHG